MEEQKIGRAVFAFLIAVLSPVIMTAAVQAQDEDDEERGDALDQTAACVSECYARISNDGSASLDACLREAPECRGLEAQRGAIRESMCTAARSISRECSSETPEGSGRGGAVLPSREEAQPRSRPSRLVLECRRPDGSTFPAAHESGRSSWRDHCDCGDGFVGVTSSAYAEPFEERIRRRQAERRGEVIRIVQCFPRGTAPSILADRREALDGELASRVQELETWRTEAEARLDDHDERIAALEWRSPEEGGLTEAAVRRIVDEEVQPIQERIATGDIPQRDAALSHRLDVLDDRIAHRQSASPGNAGFRLNLFGSFGFVNLTDDEGSMPPISVGGEFSLLLALGSGWYLEGGLAFGYAVPDVELGEAMQGVYHLGIDALIQNVFLFGFGGVLSERYGEIGENGFLSDHTLLGGYLEGNAVFRFGDSWGITLGARVLFGAGLRYDNHPDPVVPDGAVMVMLGLANFGDGIVYDHGRTRCTTPHCRDTAIGRVQVP